LAWFFPKARLVYRGFEHFSYVEYYFTKFVPPRDDFAVRFDEEPIAKKRSIMPPAG
jgi:hypothetical protein